MDSYLPKVKEETCHSIECEMADAEYVTNVAKHISAHNPTIAGFLHLFMNKLPTCCKKAAMLATFTTYRLIESQVQADKMTQELKIGE